MLYNLIKNVAHIIGDRETIEELEKFSAGLDYSHEKIDTLVLLSNFVIQDIASNFYCYKISEYITSDSNGKISISNFTFPVLKICLIRDSAGKKVSYNLFVDQIQGLNSNCTYYVTYNYYPNELTDLGDTVVLPVGLDERTICYGVVCEYYTIKMQYNEAKIWEEQYRNCLKNLFKPSKNIFFRGF